jgi:Skp family chaperone for outer membrane proteins
MLPLSAGAARADEAQLKVEIAKLKAEKAALEKQVKELTAKLDAQAASPAEQRLNKLAERMDSLLENMTRMQARFNSDIAALTDQLARLQAAPGTTPMAALPAPAATRPGTTPAVNPPTTPTVRPPTSPSEPDPFKNLIASTTPDKPTTAADLPRFPDVSPPPIKPRPRSERLPGTPTTVAMVDMLHLWNSLREKDAIEEGLTDLVYGVKFEDQKWRTKIIGYEKDLALLAVGSEAYIAKERQIENAKIDWNVAIRAAQSQLNRRRGELTKLLYQRVIDAIGRVADQNGYDAVVFKEPEPEFTKYNSMNDLFAPRMVVKANDSVDLTEQVIRLMNTEYQKAQFERAGR